MITEEKLLRKKREIDDAKNNIAELKGQEKALLAQLVNDWECKTVGDAKNKVANMEKEISSLEEQIETLSEELEKEYSERS